MAKAAVELGVKQPAVSEVIANLEHALGVRLLDRSPQGVEPTMYGNALRHRALIVFDELKQSIKDIEYLADPTTGVLRVASPLAIAFTVIPHVFERFVAKYPRVVLHFADDLNIEFLFDDQLVIAVGAKSKWAARRRKLDLAELVGEPWIMQPPDSWNYRILSEACQARGVALPGASVVTLSMSVITHFLADGQFITAMPRSVAYFKSLKVLPVNLPVRPWPVNIVTLKNRTLSPVVGRVIECARDCTRPMRERHPATKQ
jgi:DNA-binding transcriptional LysR family regulator